MQTRLVNITFIEPLLGSLNNNVNVFSEFTAAKAPTPEKSTEEIGAIAGEMTQEEIEEQIDKQTTVFPRHPKDKGNNCFCYDYQWRGFFKEALALGTEIGEEAVKGLSKWTVKKTVDSMVFITERRIDFVGEDGKPIVEVKQLERPLRAQTMRGERICLARSEIIPAGTTLQFHLKWLENKNTKSTQKVTEDALVWALNYGALKGFGQWRGGGYGRFTYTIEEVDIPKEAAKKAA